MKFAVALFPVFLVITRSAAAAPKKWRDDHRCGPDYPLSDGSPAQCDPDSRYPCCSPYDWCGNTAAHCDCEGCLDYNALKKWRDDGRCGPKYPLSDGSPAQCDPYFNYPCCSPFDWCGNTAAHCDCEGCIDYRDTKKWRDDYRCGRDYPLPNGSPAQCDPDSSAPCCSFLDWCGDTATHCYCDGCIDYREME
ncbi:uncharacterized protein LOC144436406 [Glandiceps talaboti]